MHRVVVTGLGAVTPIGLGVERFWANLRAGICGVDRIKSFDATGLAAQVAAEVDDFDARDFMDFKAARRMDRVSQFAVAAAGEAIKDAELGDVTAMGGRIGAMVNTGAGGVQTLVRETLNFHSRGPARVSPFTIPMFAPNMPACQVSITFGIRGPVMASVAACAAGTQALVDARRLLQVGEVDAMVVGGTEAAMGLMVVAFDNMGALSRRADGTASRPFDRDRDGCVVGEGCGMLVLETEEHALRRGARIYCEVVGGAMTADACHISAPAQGGEGAARAMSLALEQARLNPGEVGYICAHGTATPMNDATETAAVKAVFGDAAYRVPISAPKSMIGHLLGASGAVSGLVCALAIRDNVVPPTINLETPDPDCDLDYVPHSAREHSVDTAMANAFGFGGQNAVAVFQRYDEAA